ncbi:MAG TPA: GDP-mannose 4,6-dehydratase [Thermoplasmata archaeon]|nr:GDP-mannose 4,6-dehydratase [Thermoplasmata archaeon]
MSRVLVTGGTGFLGRYMTNFLRAQGHEVTSTFFHEPPRRLPPTQSQDEVVFLDVKDGPAVLAMIRERKPDVVYHFAGQAYVIPSWEDPAGTFDVNLRGTLHLLEAIRRTNPRCAVAFAGSGTEYGEPSRIPTPEDSPLLPTSPYASSKAAADLLCYQYFRSSEIPVFRYRIFGTTGLGKRGDVCNDFASQIATLERGGANGQLRVGDLDKKRDIQDVRDAVRAMVTVVERGEPGEAYNIGCGEARDVRRILETLRSFSQQPFTVVEEVSRKRKVDEPVHLGDIEKLRKLGWAPSISFEDTLRDILNDWRSRAS